MYILKYKLQTVKRLLANNFTDFLKSGICSSMANILPN